MKVLWVEDVIVRRVMPWHHKSDLSFTLVLEGYERPDVPEPGLTGALKMAQIFTGLPHGVNPAMYVIGSSILFDGAQQATTRWKVVMPNISPEELEAMGEWLTPRAKKLTITEDS